MGLSLAMDKPSPYKTLTSKIVYKNPWIQIHEDKVIRLGQDALTASKRELQEETGILAKSWQVLGKSSVCNGLMSEHQTTLLATDLAYGEATDTEEAINEVRFIPISTIEDMVANGKIDDGQTLAAHYLYRAHLAKAG